MKIIVNGAERETSEGSSVAGVVASVIAPAIDAGAAPDPGAGPRTGSGAGPGPAMGAATGTSRTAGVAVALNDEVVPRANWSTTIVREADRIEVLTAVQGG